MVDFRSSGGSLGIYSRTKSLRSPASSSLDKPAGTLSQVDTKAAGQAAQKVIQAAKIPKNTPVAEKSYLMSKALEDTDTGLAITKRLTPASKELISKFAAQASTEQKKQLKRAAAQSFTEEQIAEVETLVPEQPSISKILLFALGGIIVGGLLK